jgi:hypothetical protein
MAFIRGSGCSLLTICQPLRAARYFAIKRCSEPHAARTGAAILLLK